MKLQASRLHHLVLVLAIATSLGLATATPARATPGDIIWIDRYSYSVFSFAQRVLVHADGRVFVTGQGTDPDYQYDYLTIAYSPEGQRLWSRTYKGPSGNDVANDMAFGPTQHRIYIAGRSSGIVTRHDSAGEDWATVAYRADGTRLWATRYDGPKSDDDRANAVGVSSQSGRVFVTGSSTGKGTGEDITTIAYSPAGQRLWSRRYDGPASAADVATRLLVGPSGRRIYVIGTSTSSPGDEDVTIIAYKSDGTRIWTRRNSGSEGNDTVANAVLRPDGRRIYTSGSSAGDIATIAYRRDGTRIWTDRYGGPAGGSDTASDVAVAPDGHTVFVTGTSEGSQDNDVVTIAFASSGVRHWVVRHEDSGSASSDCIAVSPDGSQLFVTADIDLGHVSTVAYSSGGDFLWMAGYDERASASDSAVSPDGDSLIVTGYDDDVYEHLVTIAYSVR